MEPIPKGHHSLAPVRLNLRQCSALSTARNLRKANRGLKFVPTPVTRPQMPDKRFADILGHHRRQQHFLTLRAE
jgi:hypothetical protein